MKKGIHPEYGPAVIVCACGNKVETASTVSEMQVEICSACHPFYTGQKKIVDSAGRVDRFAKRFEVTKALQEEKRKRQEAKTKKKKKGKGKGK
ncbi:MAG: 50S ribosomal protein L31 [Candidatus Moranbacteria bacterium]|nr:50S ribosomal protein L31 [Candidatus Moranbacteria bacterium]